MKKRLTAILCMMALLLCLFPQTAFAAGSLEGVDYTRIGGTGSRVTLTLGELTFEGQLSRGTMLSQREQDKIIKQTMNDLSITSGMLINAKSMLDAAHSLEGFNIKDVGNAAMKLAGVDNFVDLYNHVMGAKDKTSAEIAADIAKGQLTDFAEDGLEDILTNGGRLALHGTGKFAFKLLFILPDLTEIGLDALAKYENIKETVAAAVERQLLLDTFYDECGKRISEASGDRGAWEIRFDKGSTQTYNCTFWGISGVMMQASLSGVLEQVSELDGAAGQYRGTLWLDLEGVDMANSFANKIKTTEPISTNITSWAYVGITSTTNNCTSASLTRRVQGELSVMLTSGGGTQQSDVSGSLTSGGDETEFVLKHEIHGTGQPAPNDINDFTLSLSSSSPDSVTVVWTKIFRHTGWFKKTTKVVDPATSINRDPGTVWKPLESKPFITVYY